MQFRVYDKKQKKYLNPSNLYISAGGKKVICPEIFFDNSTLGEIDPSRVCVEYGMKGFDGSGKMFYEGDIFASGNLSKCAFSISKIRFKSGSFLL